MQAKRLNPILNVCSIAESFAWFEKNAVWRPVHRIGGVMGLISVSFAVFWL